MDTRMGRWRFDRGWKDSESHGGLDLVADV
jgi:hypothetical protein